MCRLIPLTRGIKRLTSETLKKYLVNAIDLLVTERLVKIDIWLIRMNRPLILVTFSSGVFLVGRSQKRYNQPVEV